MGHIKLLTAEMFARQISGLSAHGTAIYRIHTVYSRTPAGATVNNVRTKYNNNNLHGLM